MQTLFLHGLESSSRGTKGRFLKGLFPDIIAPDFQGSLQMRMQKLEEVCTSLDNLIIIGSSYGGLMATCYAIKHPEKIQKLILFAPALNFPEYEPPDKPLEIQVDIIIGKADDVTPPDRVIPLAQKTFSAPSIHEVEDDHMLHQTYATLDWQQLVPSVSPR